MKNLAAFLAVATALGVITSAMAQARPDARAMSCEQVQSLIYQQGAVVLTTGRHTYDRYVAANRYCSWPNVPTRISIPTADTSSCPVYNCQRVQEPIWDD